jgi:hypothetical protein
LALIVTVADNGTMITVMLILLSLAAVVGIGLLALQYGVDSRPSDTRDLRHSWH